MIGSIHQSPPELPDDDALADLVYELTDRIKRGESVDLEQIVKDHANFADELQRLFPMLLALAKSEATTNGFSHRSHGSESLGSKSHASESHAIGDPIGDFELLREIGRGGMGVVYEAKQMSLNRRVALKVLPFAAALDPRALARFRQESQAAAQLDHPHIVHVHGMGADRGIHYYAMQYIEGQSLAQVIADMQAAAEPLDGGAETAAFKKASLSTDRAGNPQRFYRAIARLAIDAASALNYAHEQGVVHRDIKPGNLLLDDQGRVWITDFGLARIESAGNLTTTGDLLGTLRYSSPEQATGKRGLIDQRSDVYSLGATLYELLTLRPVFASGDRTELTRQIAQVDPLPLRRHVPGLPVELQTIVLKCLEKDAADRYATAQELADDLGRYLAHEPLTAKPATLAERMRKWIRRHQGAVIAASAMLSVITALLAGSAVWIIRERAATTQQTNLVLLQEGKVRQDRYVDRINLAAKAYQRGDLIEEQRQLSECIPTTGHEDLRGFEWGWLQRALHATPRPWKQHQKEVYSARFAPDGRLLATCGQDGARVWSWPDGNAEQHLNAHRSDVNEIAFSPDGSLLASASDDGTVRIWKTAGWQEVQTLPHEGKVIAAAFSPDGQTLACGERDVLADDAKVHEVVRLWSVATWEQCGKMVGAAGELEALAWSPEGSSLATAMGSSRVSIWECNPPRLRCEVSLVAGARSVAYAHHRPVLAVAVGGQVFLYNTDTWQQQEVLNGHPGCVEAVTFSAGDDSLLSTDVNGTIRLWQFTGLGDRMQEIEVFRSGTRTWCARFAPDGRQFVTTGNDAAVRLWDIRQPPDRLRIPGSDRAISASVIEFLADSQGILIGDEALKLVDVESGHVRWTMTTPGGSRIALKMSPDGRTLAAFDGAGQIALWNSDTWQQMQTIPTNFTQVNYLAFIPGTTGMLLAGPPAQLIATAAAFATKTPFSAAILENAPFVEISPDGQTAARTGLALGTPRPVEIVNLPSGDQHAVLNESLAVAFSSDGKLFASGARDAIVRLWRTSDWGEPTLLVGHSGGVDAVAFAPDGRTLASTASDGLVKLWHVSTGRELLTLEGRTDLCEFIRFSPDGNVLAVSGMAHDRHRGSQVVLWPAAAIAR